MLLRGLPFAGKEGTFFLTGPWCHLEGRLRLITVLKFGFQSTPHLLLRAARSLKEVQHPMAVKIISGESHDLTSVLKSSCTVVRSYKTIKNVSICIFYFHFLIRKRSPKSYS